MTTEKKALKKTLITRRPIFDHKKTVYAYNLLFNSQDDTPQWKNAAKKSKGSSAGEAEGYRAADFFLTNNLKRLTGGKKAFISFTPEMIRQELPYLFSREDLGIEVVTSSPIKEDEQEAVNRLRKEGYTVLMEAGTPTDNRPTYIKLADIIGMDFRAGKKEQVSVSENNPDAQLLARSVETASDYSDAEEQGYKFFQGDYFNKADILPMGSIPSYKVNSLQILKEINRPNIEFERIEQTLKRDVSITYKLLRFINSARFGLKTTVQSIYHALTLMGEMEVRKWLNLIVLSGSGEDKPEEMVTDTIVRAKLCESIASQLDKQGDTQGYFLMGMFSMVDGFLDRPMAEILEELPLDERIKSALLGEDNHHKHVLDTVRDYEQGNWKHFSKAAKSIKLPEKDMVTLYLEAVDWASNM